MHPVDPRPEDVSQAGAATLEETTKQSVEEAADEVGQLPLDPGQPTFADWRVELRQRLKQIRARRQGEQIGAAPSPTEQAPPVTASASVQVTAAEPGVPETGSPLDDLPEVVANTAEATAAADPLDALAEIEAGEAEPASPGSDGPVAAEGQSREAEAVVDEGESEGARGWKGNVLKTLDSDRDAAEEVEELADQEVAGEEEREEEIDLGTEPVAEGMEEEPAAEEAAEEWVTEPAAEEAAEEWVTEEDEVDTGPPDDSVELPPADEPLAIPEVGELDLEEPDAGDEAVLPELDLEASDVAASPVHEVDLPTDEFTEAEATVGPYWDAPSEPMEHLHPLTVAGRAAGPLGQRAAAALCDALVLLVIGASLLGAASSASAAPMTTLLTEASWPLLIAWAIFATGYSLFFVGTCGQTIGRMVMRLRVVSADHLSIGFWRAALRLVAYLVSTLPLGAGVLPALRDPLRRTLHDRMSHTRVVKA